MYPKDVLVAGRKKLFHSYLQSKPICILGLAVVSLPLV